MAECRVGHTRVVGGASEAESGDGSWGRAASTWFEPETYGGLDDSAPSAAVIVRLVDEILSPSSVVDVGCGPGIFLAEWIRLGSPTFSEWTASRCRRSTGHRPPVSG